jgi:hypothetical protein
MDKIKSLEELIQESIYILDAGKIPIDYIQNLLALYPGKEKFIIEYCKDYIRQATAELAEVINARYDPMITTKFSGKTSVKVLYELQVIFLEWLEEQTDKIHATSKKRKHPEKKERLKDIWTREISLIQELRIKLFNAKYTVLLDNGLYQWEKELIWLVALSEELRDKRLCNWPGRNQRKTARAFCNEFNKEITPYAYQVFKAFEDAKKHQYLFTDIAKQLKDTKPTI